MRSHVFLKRTVCMLLLCVLLLALTACAAKPEKSETPAKQNPPHFDELTSMLGKSWKDAGAALGYSEQQLQEGLEGNIASYYVHIPEKVEYLGMEWDIVLKFNSNDPESPEGILRVIYVRHYDDTDLTARATQAVKDSLAVRDSLLEEYGEMKETAVVIPEYTEEEIIERFSTKPRGSKNENWVANLQFGTGWDLENNISSELFMTGTPEKTDLMLIYYSTNHS